jgi:hypothetical protein
MPPAWSSCPAVTLVYSGRVSAAGLALSGGHGLTADEPARAAGPAAGVALKPASLRP